MKRYYLLVAVCACLLPLIPSPPQHGPRHVFPAPGFRLETDGQWFRFVPPPWLAPEPDARQYRRREDAVAETWAAWGAASDWRKTP